MKKIIKSYLFQRRIIAMATGCSVLLFIAGCSTKVISISPSTTPVTERDSYTKCGPAVGKASGFMILGIPFEPSEPSKKARDVAIKNGTGNALIEVTEEYNMLNLLVVAFFWTKVEGTAVQLEHAGEEIE